MKRRTLWAAAAAAVLTACAGLVPGPVVLSESEIASLLARDFPRQRRLFELLDVTVAAPRVRLLPELNRIATDLDFSAADRLTGRPLRGSLALDYALRFEPSDASVRLSQVRVERVHLDAGGRTLPVSAQRVGVLIAERLLDEAVIWRARPEVTQRLQALGLSRGAVNVRPHGVEISLLR